MPPRRSLAAIVAAAAAASSVLSGAAAFVAPRTTPSFAAAPRRSSSTSVGMSDFGNIEEIEFRIYPDGRIEETVRGIRGEDCHEVTESINGMLGKVTESAPTEEMYENEVVVSNTVEEKLDGGSDRGSGGWEGASSW